MNISHINGGTDKRYVEADKRMLAVNEFLQSAWEFGYRSLSLEPGLGGEFQLRAKQQGRWITPDNLALPAVEPHWLVARLKVMALLDIGQNSIAQDGLVESIHGLDGVQAIFRVLPTSNGELITIHFSDKRADAVSLPGLGLPQGISECLPGVFEQRGGIVLAAGPSGHGRMETLYALAERFLLPEKRLFSAEVAPLRELQGVPKASVLKYAGVNYDQVLANIGGHDPDAVLVGELVNIDTAKKAFELTGDGVWVLSRLSVERPGDCVKRLLDMGIDPLALGSSLRLVIGQRQVRLLCTDCRLREEAGVYPYAAVGCKACDQSGYTGQETLFEAIIPDSGFRDLMSRFDINWGYEQIEKYLNTATSKSLRRQALELAKQGLTTAQEAALKTPKANPYI